MTQYKDFSDDIKQKIYTIKAKLLDGQISLLDEDLVPIFDELRDSLNTLNINKYSKTYMEACELLDEKFRELVVLLNRLDEEKKFQEYLESEPSDKEILELIGDCWLQTFDLDYLSFDFLKESMEKLTHKISKPYQIQHPLQTRSKDKFILEVSKERFGQKMEEFFERIKEKLPCYFEELFENLPNQIEIYEKFVYILHLLQQGRLKYQKETKTVYL
ncbi:MAG: hypothetical protein GF317_25105 [Candidatus Lokiarchaeota archaeon]|nr:hypothetical protein [Candidatus Lokiarchaeota archaeon]MBD3202638.1 hypothetical protein [Candidatus Lokiarchaeota archaeon]